MALHYELISNINMQQKYWLNNGDYIRVILLPMLNNNAVVVVGGY